MRSQNVREGSGFTAVERKNSEIFNLSVVRYFP